MNTETIEKIDLHTKILVNDIGELINIYLKTNSSELNHKEFFNSVTNAFFVSWALVVRDITEKSINPMEFIDFSYNNAIATLNESRKALIQFFKITRENNE